MRHLVNKGETSILSSSEPPQKGSSASVWMTDCSSHSSQHHQNMCMEGVENLVLMVCTCIYHARSSCPCEVRGQRGRGDRLFRNSGGLPTCIPFLVSSSRLTTLCSPLAICPANVFSISATCPINFFSFASCVHPQQAVLPSICMIG